MCSASDFPPYPQPLRDLERLRGGPHRAQGQRAPARATADELAEGCPVGWWRRVGHPKVPVDKSIRCGYLPDMDTTPDTTPQAPTLTRPRLTREDVEPVYTTLQREQYSFLGTYYRWCASRPYPTLPGGDPLTGGKPNGFDARTARMARAAYIALAREALAIARTFGPTPLPFPATPILKALKAAADVDNVADAVDVGDMAHAAAWLAEAAKDVLPIIDPTFEALASA